MYKNSKICPKNSIKILKYSQKIYKNSKIYPKNVLKKIKKFPKNSKNIFKKF